MEQFSKAELAMWGTSARKPKPVMTDDEINAKYTSREWRIVTESNREQLPNFIEALKRQGWMDLRPFYQRRLRWTPDRQSKLIESFIMNVPVPPLFVYEADLAKYEVMDGQQRITAIKEFYNNEFRLTGLEQWPELNGRTYAKLPSEIKKGIDRRSISYTVLLKESAETSEEQTLLRQLIFERLNTGGVELTQQEVRHCLYQGAFNTLLLKLAKHPAFRNAWRMQEYSAEEDRNPPQSLLKNPFYAKMTDVETVLRFFALRNAQHYQRGMQGFLDLYMVRARRFNDEDLEFLSKVFNETIEVATSIFGKLLFRPWLPKEKKWDDSPHRAFSDAIMVAVSRKLNKTKDLIAHREQILERTKLLFEEDEKGTFVGRGNTKADVNDRIDQFESMLTSVAR